MTQLNLPNFSLTFHEYIGLKTDGLNYSDWRHAELLMWLVHATLDEETILERAAF